MDRREKPGGFERICRGGPDCAGYCPDCVSEGGDCDICGGLGGYTDDHPCDPEAVAVCQSCREYANAMRYPEEDEE